MMMDNDFPMIAKETSNPRSPYDVYKAPDWAKPKYPQQPQEPEQEGPVKNAAGLGYLQEYIAGMNQYQQGGTDVADFGVRSDYSREQGGPLVSRTIRYTPPNAIIKAPALDSPYMDELIKRGFQPLSPPRPKGPQLPSFL
jgi:hypothetical protein